MLQIGDGRWAIADFQVRYRAGAGLNVAGSGQLPSNGGQFGTGISAGG